MKKYFLTSAAALAICGLFTSCTHDLGYDESSAQNSVVKTYEQAFVTAFGQPDPNNEWGFGTSTAKAATRSITVNGDVYDAFTFPSSDELRAAFPTGVPENAKTDAQLEDLYVGQTVKNADGTEYKPYGWPVTMYDMYAVYLNVVGKTEMDVLVNTPGEYTVGHSYANPANQVYNVYINIGEGNNLTLKRNGAEHVNFYILSGNITIDKDFGECGGIISVASGATVNDQRDHIAHNDGIKVYNRGTYNATNTTETTANLDNKNVSYCYAIGNNVKFYNEATFTVSGALAYNSGAGNTAWFYNLGDGVRLTAPSMTLNSTCNFFSDGIVNITDETFVTKDGIVWVNNGHYTTGSITWSAKNTSFYNYCQLIVRGNAHMYDGEFNLMDNSYTEAGTAEMDNFIVNMGSNTGMYIKGNVRMIAQGDGTYQGFKTNGGSNDYLLIGGKVTVDSHYHTFSISSGITYSINALEIVRGGSIVTEEQLQREGSGDYPVLDFNGTECPYGELTVTPNENSCGANWHGDDPDPDPNILRIICEDLSVKESTDWDFNDVVFDIQLVENNQAKITLLAAGGTLPLYIGDEDHEVHDLFAAVPENSDKGITRSTMINTGSTGNKYNLRNCKEAIFRLDILSDWTAGAGPSTSEEDLLKIVAKNLPVRVLKLVNGERRWVTLPCEPGEATAKVATNGGKNGFEWCDERQHINRKYFYEDVYGNDYGGFTLFVQGFLSAENWHNYKGPITEEMSNGYTGQ